MIRYHNFAELFQKIQREIKNFFHEATWRTHKIRERTIAQAIRRRARGGERAEVRDGVLGWRRDASS
jgi:hypothetical protein